MLIFMDFYKCYGWTWNYWCLFIKIKNKTLWGCHGSFSLYNTPVLFYLLFIHIPYCSGVSGLIFKMLDLHLHLPWGTSFSGLMTTSTISSHTFLKMMPLRPVILVCLLGHLHPPGWGCFWQTLGNMIKLFKELLNSTLLPTFPRLWDLHW